MTSLLSQPVPASHIRSFGLLYLTMIGMVVAAFLLAYHRGLDLVGLFVLGYGLLLLVWTLGQSWAFWNHPTTLWWRGLVGDNWARRVFIVLSVGFIVVGGVDIRLGLREVEQCRQLLASATDVHQRMQALSMHPGKARAGLQDPIGLREQPLTCEDYRERGAF
jgi:hypothetical protein